MQNMISLEALEKGTPEFQALTPHQQQARRVILKGFLDNVITNRADLSLSEQETAIMVCNMLEFHLIGKVDTAIIANPQIKRGRKSHKK